MIDDRPWTAERIAALVQDFEACTWPKEHWDHQAHLLVCFWYVATFGMESAIERMRGGIQRYNLANGFPMTPTGGYHETLTVFWTRAMGDFFASADRGRGLEALANEMLACFSDTRFVLTYYTRERLMSIEARYGWLEPDLKAMNCAT